MQNCDLGWPEIKAQLDVNPSIEKYERKKLSYSNKTNRTINIEKFQEDCNLFKTILGNTIKSLSDTASFEPLKKLSDNYKLESENEQTFLQEAEENKKEYDKLFNAIENKKLENFLSIQECTVEIGKLKDEIAVSNYFALKM